jgi:class 3 adenylate cyclase
MRDLGVEVRTGLHTGEIELVGDDVRGMAVNIGARVSALAGPGEVLVSSTVKDLVAGSGFAFEDRRARTQGRPRPMAPVCGHGWLTHLSLYEISSSSRAAGVSPEWRRRT